MIGLCSLILEEKPTTNLSMIVNGGFYLQTECSCSQGLTSCCSKFNDFLVSRVIAVSTSILSFALQPEPFLVVPLKVGASLLQYLCLQDVLHPSGSYLDTVLQHTVKDIFNFKKNYNHNKLHECGETFAANRKPRLLRSNY